MAIVSIGLGIIIVIVVGKGILGSTGLADRAQIAATRRYDRGFRRGPRQATSGRLVAEAVGIVVGRGATDRGAQTIIVGRAAGARRATALLGQFGNSHARNLGLGLFFDRVESLGVTVGGIGSGARGTGGIQSGGVPVWYVSFCD